MISRLGHSVDEFLSSINFDSIQEVVHDFEHALNIPVDTLSISSVHATSLICGTTLEAVRIDPTSADTAVSIINFWTQLKTMNDITLLSNVTTCATRALLMLSAWTMMDWVTKTVSETQKGRHKGTWIDRLLADIKSTIQQSTTKSNACLMPSTYLPHLTTASAYTFAVPRLLMDIDKLNLSVSSLAINAIQQWLGFPTSAKTVVQNSLIGTLMDCGTPAILFIDEVWKMYQSPYRYVIHARGSKQRQSNPHDRNILKIFHKQFQEHAVMDPNNPVAKRLNHLDSLIDLWSSKSLVKFSTKSGHSKSIKSVCWFSVFSSGLADLF